MVSWVRSMLPVPRPTILCDPDEEEEAPKDLKRPRVHGTGTPTRFATLFLGGFSANAPRAGALRSVLQASGLASGGGIAIGKPGFYAFDVVPPAQEQSGPGPRGKPLRIVVISDTHEFHNQLTLPPGDVLMHCGDFLASDKYSPGPVSNYNLRHFFAWMNRQPFALRIAVGGNHDVQAQRIGNAAMRALAAPTLWLEDELIEVAGLRVFGTPRSTPNSDTSPNRAFQQLDAMPDSLPDTVSRFVPCDSPRGNGKGPSGYWRVESTVERASLPLPDHVDILMSHGAPNCPRVRAMVDRLDPSIHCFGHVHGMRGLFNRDGSNATPSAPPPRPSIGAASMQGATFKDWIAPPIAIDYMPRDPQLSAAAITANAPPRRTRTTSGPDAAGERTTAPPSRTVVHVKASSK